MKYLIPTVLASSALLMSSGVMAATTDVRLSNQVQAIDAQTQQLQKEVASLRQQLHSKKGAVSKVGLAADDPYKHFVTVTTSPFIGSSTNYNSSDVLFQTSSMNEDLILLRQHQQVDKYLKERGYTLNRPIVEISGGLEGQLYHVEGFGQQSTDKGISLSNAELDVNALAGSWASAFMSINYTDMSTSEGNRDPLEVLYLKRGFFTLGNLSKFPVYFTMGKIYSPFGKYSSTMLTTPLTLSLGRISTTNAILGVSSHGFSGQVYGYSGSKTTGGSKVFKQGGLNASYEKDFSKGSVEFGAGLVSNLGDSQGMQDTGNKGSGEFQGFGINGNALKHNVSALNVQGKLEYASFAFIGEYVGALRSFDINDLTYDTGKAAAPKAMHFEVDYTFHALKRPWTAGVMYGRSFQALALNLPKDSYSVILQTSMVRNTLQTIEYRHDKDFTGTATGGSTQPANAIVGTGRTRNSVIAQVGVYF